MDHPDGWQMLARDHQAGLALALKIQGKGRPVEDPEWPDSRPLQRDRVVAFFDEGLEAHLLAEEQCLFPAAESCFASGEELLALLRKQHAQIRTLAGQLREARDVQLENLLLRFAHVLEENIRKEDRNFRAHFEREVPESRRISAGRQVAEFLEKRRGPAGAAEGLPE